MPKLSIIIPCYNEEKTIEEVLERVKLAPLPEGWSKEIIIVDDCSTDRTREIIKKYQNELRVVFKEKNQGKGSALKEGFKIVSGDYILIQDADLEYDPRDYLKLLEPIIENKADIVFGSRVLNKNNVSFSQVYFYGGLLISKIFNLLFGTKLTDIATCYKLFPRSLAPKLIYLSSNDFVFDVIELTHQLVLNGRIVEVPISYKARSRKEGKKINWRHGVKCLFSMLKIKFNLDKKK